MTLVLERRGCDSVRTAAKTETACEWCITVFKSACDLQPSNNLEDVEGGISVTFINS